MRTDALIHPTAMLVYLDCRSVRRQAIMSDGRQAAHKYASVMMGGRRKGDTLPKPLYIVTWRWKP